MCRCYACVGGLITRQWRAKVFWLIASASDVLFGGCTERVLQSIIIELSTVPVQP